MKKSISFSSFFCCKLNFRHIILLAALLLPASFALAGELVAYYSFDNASDLVNDDSGNAHDLIVHRGSPVATPNGAVNGAADFNGVLDSYFLLNRQHTQLYPAGDFTVSVWAKANSTPPTNRTTWITRNRYNCGFGIYTNTDGRWAAGVSNSGVATTNNVTSGNQRIRGTAIVVDEWVHIVLTFDAQGGPDANGVYTGDETLYINGEVIGVKTVGYRARSDSNSTNGDRFGVAENASGVTDPNGGYFDGGIDEFAIFKGVLSRKQITALATKQATPLAVLDIPSLNAYYSFNDSLDPNHDNSGHALHLGTLEGTPTPITGTIGGAVNFDGSDRFGFTFTASDQNEIYPSGSFAVAAWVRAKSVPTTAPTFVSRSRYQNSGFAIATGATVNNSEFVDVGKWAIGVAAATGTDRRRYISDTDTIDVNVWTHLAFTFVPSGAKGSAGYHGTGKFYVDGELVGTRTDLIYNPFYYNSSSDKFGVGGAGNAGVSFDGDIDEFVVFQGVVTEEDIGALAAKEKSPFDITEPSIVRTLLAYYSFDNASDANHDDSGNGIHLTNSYGDAPAATTGVVNGAVDFDGTNDEYDSVRIDTLYPASSFTVSVWARNDNASVGATFTSPRYIKIGGYVIYTDAGTQKWYAGVYSGPDGGVGALYKINGPLIVTGQWTHIAFTFSPTGGTDSYGGYKGTGVLYINGSIYASKTEMYYRSPAAVVKLGLGSSPSGSGWFDGGIDEFAVFKGVLNETEINLLAVGAATPLNVLSALDEPIPGDLNNDGSVDMVDFSIFAADWMAEAVK